LQKSNVSVLASAPGRVDLLNTHQDYKGLPVVPASINLRTYVRAETTVSRVVRVRSLDLQKLGEPSYDEIPIDTISIREGLVWQLLQSRLENSGQLGSKAFRR
jgi:galactokinase